MYEEKPKKGLNINWKSLIIKMVILLVALFIIIWIISLVKKPKTEEKASNIATNLQSMKEAAMDYFTGSKLPENVNGKKKITLQEMFDEKLLLEFKDQDNKSCNGTESYAEATKINSEDYSIKVKLVCTKDTDYVINTIHVAEDTNTSTDLEENNVPNIPTDTTNNNNNNSNNNNSNNNTNSNNNNHTSNNNNNSNANTSNKNDGANNSNIAISTVCSYGKKDYNSSMPLAYLVSGNCAVSKSVLYQAINANAVSKIDAQEYKKLYTEIVALKNKTGADLYIEDREFIPVMNINKTGYVGFQIKYQLKQRLNYQTKTIYSYYLDQNGNRKVIIDNRSSLNNNNNNNSNSDSTITKVTSVDINKSSLDLYVGEAYTLAVTINPTNATNKTVTWSSSNTRIATVNSNGKVTAKRAGTATITATVDGKSDSIKVYVNEEESYTYCSTKKERVYSTGYIDVNSLKNRTSYYTNYQVSYETSNAPYYLDVEYGNLEYGNEYASAYNYWKNSNKSLSLVGGSGKGIDAGSYVQLSHSSLKEYNFEPSVTFVKRRGNTLYFDIELDYFNLKNIRNATPFIVNDNYSVYFLPVYFDVIYLNNNDCEVITKSQVKEYKNKGYIKVN